MKKLFALLTSAILFATLLAACGGGSSSSAAPADEPADTPEASSAASEAAGSEAASTGGEATGTVDGKIALVMSHMTNAFTTTFADAAKAQAEEMGVELTVFDGNQDSGTQISQIESAITQGYVGIMVEPVSVDGITPAVEAANNAGIPVVTVIQQMSEQELAASYVGGNEIAAGALEMEKAVEAIGGKGSIAILYGPMGSDAQLIRKEGYDQVLAENPDVTVVFEQTANWTTDEALKVTENWLQTGTEINAIVAQNDGMAVGAMKAVEDAKMRDSISIFGIDASPDGVAAIAAGRMDGTVSQDTPGMGRLSVETLVKVINGEEVDAIVNTTAIWVTSENVSEFE